MKKNKSLLVILILALFIIISYQSLLASEKTVVLTVPGCVWAKTAARVGSILKSIDGVSNVDTDPANHTTTVTFDNEKTNLETIKKALADGGFPVKGDPKIIK